MRLSCSAAASAAHLLRPLFDKSELGAKLYVAAHRGHAGHDLTRGAPSTPCLLGTVRSGG